MPSSSSWLQFPLGRPILLMVLVAVLTGLSVAMRDPPERKDLTVWLFAELHEATYRSVISEFEKQTGKRVDLQLINGRALPARLEAMFMSGTRGHPLPDVVELEINWIGRFLRPPVEQVELLPLNDLLKQKGHDKRIIAGRFAPWSKQGVIFGVPHDVHPVAIAYRKDLFDEAGVDLASAATWSELQQKCLAFQAYWRARGQEHRHAIELPRASSDYVVGMLLQRGINLIEADEKIHLTDPRVAETVAFYAQLVAGPKRIASESAGGTGLWTKDAVAGNLCAFMMPDWRVFNLKQYAPALEGKLRMMPLPRFDPDDSPTTTWGGTMIGIPRGSADHDDAWKLIEFLYFSESGLKARQRLTNILPAVIEQWDDPLYHRDDPYFAGQKVDELYVELAHEIPHRRVTPATTIAQLQLSVILTRAVEHLESRGDKGLREQIELWLREADDDLQRRIDHGKMPS